MNCEHRTDAGVCGQPVRFTSTTLCEDCWADNAQRYSGNSQRVPVASLSRAEEQRHAARQQEILKALNGS